MTLGFIGGLGMQEILLIALVVLLFFGGKKIPELMKELGKGVRSFKEGMNGIEKDLQSTPGDEQKMSKNSGTQSFWNHLGVLRSVLIGIIAVSAACGIVAFIFKEALFSVALAPKDNDFITYRMLCRALAKHLLRPGGDEFSVQLINTGLAQQFMIHMKTAMCAGCCVHLPTSYMRYSGLCRRRYTTTNVVTH